jgi:hypothetical protein
VDFTLVEHPQSDGGCRQDNLDRGKLPAQMTPMLIPSGVSKWGPRRARKGVGCLGRGGLRYVPYPCESTPTVQAPSREDRGEQRCNCSGILNRPAAAVIPAPIAYIKVVAVKKLVVEPWPWLAGPPHRVHWSGRAFPSGEPHTLHWVCRGTRTFPLEKLECSKQL